MKKIALMLACAGCLTGPAAAQNEMAQILGYSQLIYAAEKCPFKVDEQALAAHLVEQGLADPELYGQVMNWVQMKRDSEEEVTSLECAVSKAVAQENGLLSAK